MINKAIKISSAFIVGCSTFGGLFSQDTLKFKSLPITKNLIVLEKEEKEEINLNAIYPVYALKDTVIYNTPTSISGVINNVSIGEEIFVDGELVGDNYIKYFHTAKGYIKYTDFTDNEDYVFYPTNEIKYADYDAPLVNAPNDESEIVAYIIFNEEVALTGYNHNGYYVYADDPALFISENYLMDEKYIAPVVEPIDETPSPQTIYTPATSGCLTPSAGVFAGPSGKETYYNLPMGGVISIAQNAGIYGNYWIRNDGVKMYGDYVMCACGFSVRPRGTTVQTSLGMGICLDTGGFAENDPYQIDVAVDW